MFFLTPDHSLNSQCFRPPGWQISNWTKTDLEDYIVSSKVKSIASVNPRQRSGFFLKCKKWDSRLPG